MNIRNDAPVKELFVLDKIRIYRKIVADAYSLLIAHTRTLFVSVWPICFFTGMMLTVCCYCAHQDNVLLSYIADTLFFLLGLLMVALMIQVLNQVLKGYDNQEVMLPYKYGKQSLSSLLAHSLGSWVILLSNCVLGAAILFLAVFFFPQLTVVMVIACLFIGFLQVPFTLGLFRHAVLAQPVAASLRYGFCRTFRYFGSTLFLLFVSGVLFGLLGFVLCLPLEVLDLSISQSDFAVASGDPTDIPAYIYILYYMLSIFLFTILSYLLLIPVIPQILHARSLYLLEHTGR